VNKHSKWITALAVVGLSASLAVAGTNGENGSGHHGHHRGRMEAKLAKKLNITDTQKAQLKDMHRASREQNKAFFAQAKATRQEFKAAKQAGDQAKMDALKPTLKAEREQMKQIRQAERQQFVALLTPEQKAQFDALKAQWQARRAERQQH